VLSVIRELWAYMRERKKLWLAPIIVVWFSLEACCFSLKGRRWLRSSIRSSETKVVRRGLQAHAKRPEKLVESGIPRSDFSEPQSRGARVGEVAGNAVSKR